MNPRTPLLDKPTNPDTTSVEIELVAVRRVLGLNQAQLAKAIGTTPRTVSRWKSAGVDRTAPSPSAARALREIAELRWLLETDLGEHAARVWMESPNRAIRGRAPIDLMLEGDYKTVLGLVHTIGQGGLF